MRPVAIRATRHADKTEGGNLPVESVPIGPQGFSMTGSTLPNDVKLPSGCFHPANLVCCMAIDANVLIFERIREELRSGKSPKAALDTGYTKAFMTILDTHVASLISAAFLFQFGTGPIRGFATTLTIGLLSNIFTAVFVSRTAFELALSRRQNATSLSI